MLSLTNHASCTRWKHKAMDEVRRCKNPACRVELTGYHGNVTRCRTCSEIRRHTNRNVKAKHTRKPVTQAHIMAYLREHPKAHELIIQAILKGRK